MQALKLAKYISIITLVALAVIWVTAPKAKPPRTVMLENAITKTVLVYHVTQMQRMAGDESNTLIFKAYTTTATATGSGVVITKSGHILSCAHIFNTFPKTASINIRDSKGRLYQAKLVGQSAYYDLALLKIESHKPLPYMKLAKTPLYIGQDVFAIGFPLRVPFTVTHGIIGRVYPDQTQSDAFLNPGNSGGALVDTNGQLAGINQRFKASVNAHIFAGLGFSVGPDEIREFLRHYKVL
jgi:S1-C subfamily serine protease